MSTDNPLVTVVICVYNAGRYLRQSVLSVVNQTYRALEILIIDDGSTDGCIETIEDLISSDERIRMFRQANAGKPRALNRALDEMRGAFYAVHDADDISHPQRIERQLRCFLDYPEVAAVFCGNDLILGDRQIAPLSRSRDVAECRRYIAGCRMPAHDPTAMYRSSMVRDLRYAPELRQGEGFDYIMRVGEGRPMMVLGECLYSYRIHPESVTKRQPEERHRLVWEVLRRACERRGQDLEETYGTAAEHQAQSNRGRDNNLAAHFMDSVCDQRRAGRSAAAVATALFCARLHPLDFHYWKALIYAVAPLRLVDRVRGRARGNQGGSADGGDGDSRSAAGREQVAI